jgi:hypothetical protein
VAWFLPAAVRAAPLLSHYTKVGVEELDQDKPAPPLQLKYKSMADAVVDLG